MYSYDNFVRLFAISCYFLCLFYSNVLTLCHLAGITMNVDVAGRVNHEAFNQSYKNSSQ